MNIISISDIHEDVETLLELRNEFINSDAVVIAGDITNYKNRTRAAEVISIIEHFNSNILAVFGNLDNIDVNEYLVEKGYSLHGCSKMLDDVAFFGVGGSNYTPFKTLSEYSEEEIYQILEKAYEQIKDINVKIMVSHVPPYDTEVDVTKSGLHVGSKAVRKFIDKHKISLCICGHVHEAKGMDILGDTLIYNSGMLKDRSYLRINVINNDVIVNIKDI